MATAATTTTNQPVTYALLVIFTVDPPLISTFTTNKPSATTPRPGSRASTRRFTASTFARPTSHHRWGAPAPHCLMWRRPL